MDIGQAALLCNALRAAFPYNLFLGNPHEVSVRCGTFKAEDIKFLVTLPVWPVLGKRISIIAEKRTTICLCPVIKSHHWLPSPFALIASHWGQRIYKTAATLQDN